MPSAGTIGFVLLAALSGLFLGAAQAQQNLALAIFGAAAIVWLFFSLQGTERNARIVGACFFLLGLFVWLIR